MTKSLFWCLPSEPSASRPWQCGSCRENTSMIRKPHSRRRYDCFSLGFLLVAACMVVAVNLWDSSQVSTTRRASLDDDHHATLWWIAPVSQSLNMTETTTMTATTATTPSIVSSLSIPSVNTTHASSALLVSPRAFDSWPVDRPLPCFPPDKGVVLTKEKVEVSYNQPAFRGFFFLKTYKTASSTAAGVNLRIARNVAARHFQNTTATTAAAAAAAAVNTNTNVSSFDFCNARFDHGQPWHRHGVTMFGRRTKAQSFLWAILRHPTRRAVSQFFHFKVSRQGIEPTDENFKAAMQKDKKLYYIRSMSTRRRVHVGRDDGYVVAREILQDYDFVGVTERIDESFVALAMILRIPLSDILYLSAKLNGGYDGQCTFIQPSFVSEGMQEYFDSPAWNEMIQEDLSLYTAANASLDLTIERLGRVAFEQQLTKYQQALQIGRERCAHTAVFPCGKRGHFIKKTSCLWKDAGCGAKCLDQVAAELGIDTIT